MRVLLVEKVSQICRRQTVIVSRGFAARAGRFRLKPKPFLAFFMAVSM